MNNTFDEMSELLNFLESERKDLRDAAYSEVDYAMADGYYRCICDMCKFMLAKQVNKKENNEMPTNVKLKQIANVINKINEIIEILEKGE